jgi:hypothetical protein
MATGVVVGLLLGLGIDRVVTAVWAPRAAVAEATAGAAATPVAVTATGGTLVR